MSQINILNYEIYSSQGDLSTTIESIQRETTTLSSKVISIENSTVDIPFYAFEEEVQQNQTNIYAVLEKILKKITVKMSNEEKKETALLIGTSIIDWNLVNAIENTVYEYKKTPYESHKQSIDSYAKELSDAFGLNGFTMSINTACTSSANAMLEASNLIDSAVCKYAIVLGVEIYSPLMSSGFYLMDLISQSHAKPFDIDRDGLVLGEGIAAILLGGKKSQWSLMGGFSNCNSQTITSVSQSGEECREVMQKALVDADVKSEDITALKAHATGSHSNDLAEMNAISSLFENSLIFTAVKPYIGHTIGASGALEIALFMGAIDRGFIPKTLFCDKPILEEYMPLTENLACDSGIFMCNYFGFGGNNISLIIKKELL